MFRGAFGIALVAAAAVASAQEQADFQTLTDDTVNQIAAALGKTQAQLVRQLGKYGEPGLTALLKLVGGSDHRLSSTAMQEAIKARSPRVLPVLLVKLKDSEESDRSTVILALGNHGNPRALEVLAPYALYESWIVRFATAYALGKFGDPRGIETLNGLADDPSHSVRWQAKESIKWIKSMQRKYPDRLNKQQWWDRRQSPGCGPSTSSGECPRSRAP